MNEEEKKIAAVKEAAELAEKEKLEAEKKAKEEANEANEAENAAKNIDTTDYKAIAEANEALAIAEKERADAAEALIIKNKKIEKRQVNQGDETLTEERVLELIEASKVKVDDSEEAKRLDEANKKVKEAQAKTAELARALKAKETASKDIISAQRDGLPGAAPKLPENSPLKAYKYKGNNIYSKKLPSGKTLFRNTKPNPGEPKSWVE